MLSNWSSYFQNCSVKETYIMLLRHKTEDFQLPQKIHTDAQRQIFLSPGFVCIENASLPVSYMGYALRKYLLYMSPCTFTLCIFAKRFLKVHNSLSYVFLSLRNGLYIPCCIHKGKVVFVSELTDETPTATTLLSHKTLLPIGISVSLLILSPLPSRPSLCRSDFIE